MQTPDLQNKATTLEFQKEISKPKKNMKNEKRTATTASVFEFDPTVWPTTTNGPKIPAMSIGVQC